MKFSALFASAVLVASAGLASATTLNLASYGTTATAPVGVANSATQFNGALVIAIPPVMGAGPTYNLPTGGVWTAPTGASSWVGIDRRDYPGGGHVEPDGVYDYTSTFYLSNASLASGTLTVMADDTTSVWLNNTELVDAASFLFPASSCTAANPNCMSPLTINLAGFQNGINTLRFDVHQDFGSATGLDFSGTVNVTPEPNSFLLLSSGLSTLAGVAFRRRRMQA
jgi:hypothetical protein